MDAIEYVASGDMRKAINALQAAALLGDTVDEDTIYLITSTAKPEEIKVDKGRYIRGFRVLRESLTTFFFPKGCRARTWWSSSTGRCLTWTSQKPKRSGSLIGSER